MTHIEAMKQWLEALEHGLDYAKSEQFENAQRYKGYENLAPNDADSVQLIETAITSLRQAIAEAEQESVANSSAWWALVMNAAASIEEASWSLRDEDAKQQAVGAAKHFREAAHALNTHPQPKREPLTQQEVVDGFCKLPHEVQFVAVFDAGVRFAEAAHGIGAKE